ncbi:DUF3291 domain-containing protein [Pararhizobium sp.]|uniref:DUF3291 domain-containing protein n=1 Tax=Pararhizobium sp. TaxID=1977563 RepID=UPI0027239496|nr:DUF3291 domain-containing protein [Pararhizobium sp.]MDO9417904.1 DUF3291 domain-containing protein [Pararhizobium sp.]
MYNFGLHVAGYDQPEVQGFLEREPFNFEAARRAKGFVGRSGYIGEPGTRSWGPQVFPRFIEGSGRETGPSSLSLWQDIESLMAFAYNGVHADALKHRRAWNLENSWPPLVLWWVDARHRPVWAEAAPKLEQLHDHGAGPSAFTFKQPYGPDGEPYVIDRARVRELALANEDGQRELLAEVLKLKV